MRTEHATGPVLDAACDLADLAAWAAPGDAIRVRALQDHEGPAFSTRAVSQNPWLRIERAYPVGSVVRGRVSLVERDSLLVELLPGARVRVPRNELDWDPSPDARELFRVGECIHGELLALDPVQHRGLLSIRRAHGRQPLPPLVVDPGEPPFLADERPRPSDVKPTAAGGSANAEESLRERLRASQAQVAELRKRLRGIEDRARYQTQSAAADLDPLSGPAAFLCAVRVEHARRFDECDRARYPLQAMRVGPAFLDSLRALEGVALPKVIEVCAQVASLRAHEIPAREVHPLRAGAPGSPARTRATDGARAWRCSLQDATASARRLHWWDVPGDAGRTIEFASVGLHDEVSIPE